MKISTIKKIYLMSGALYLILLVLAWFLDSVALIFVCLFLVGTILIFFKGRFWCNWICPRGHFYSYFVKYISRNKKHPDSLRNTTLQFLVMFFITSLLIYNIAINWGDWIAISRIFIILITFTTIVGITIGAIYQPRSWCRICSAATITKHMSLQKKEDLSEEHFN